MADSGGGSRKHASSQDEGGGSRKRDSEKTEPSSMRDGSRRTKPRKEQLAAEERELKKLEEHSPAGKSWATADPALVIDPSAGPRTRSGGSRGRPPANLDLIEQEDISEKNIFQFPDHGSLIDKSLELAKQLLFHLEGCPDDAPNDSPSDSEEDVPRRKNFSARKTGIDATKSFETQMKDESKGTRLSIALLGNNGDGKSEFANWAAQVCLL